MLQYRVPHKSNIIGKMLKKKAKQKLLLTELAQYAHHCSQYTNSDKISNHETHENVC